MEAPKKPIFSQKKAFLIFQQMETPKKFFIFQETKTLKNFLYFRKQNFLIFQERQFQNPGLFRTLTKLELEALNTVKHLQLSVLQNYLAYFLILLEMKLS